MGATVQTKPTAQWTDSEAWSVPCGRQPTCLLRTEPYGGAGHSVQRWMGGRWLITRLHGRERGSVPGRGPAEAAEHGHTPSMGVTEDPSFPCGGSGFARRGGGRAGEGKESFQSRSNVRIPVDSESRAGSSPGQPSSFALL